MYVETNFRAKEIKPEYKRNTAMPLAAWSAGKSGGENSEGMSFDTHPWQHTAALFFSAALSSLSPSVSQCPLC
jgi:hypothetical protein